LGPRLAYCVAFALLRCRLSAIAGKPPALANNLIVAWGMVSGIGCGKTKSALPKPSPAPLDPGVRLSLHLLTWGSGSALVFAWQQRQAQRIAFGLTPSANRCHQALIILRLEDRLPCCLRSNSRSTSTPLAALLGRLNAYMKKEKTSNGCVRACLRLARRGHAQRSRLGSLVGSAAPQALKEKTSPGGALNPPARLHYGSAITPDAGAWLRAWARSQNSSLANALTSPLFSR
jgi:hypothetical protein